jgi:hypothetical protein
VAKKKGGAVPLSFVRVSAALVASSFVVEARKAVGEDEPATTATLRPRTPRFRRNDANEDRAPNPSASFTGHATSSALSSSTARPAVRPIVRRLTSVGLVACLVQGRSSIVMRRLKVEVANKRTRM